MGAYYRYLTGNDEKKKMECAKAWSFWEMFTSKLYVSPENIARAEEDDVFYPLFFRLLILVSLYYFVLVCNLFCKN